MARASRPYHHGDLRRALLVEAAQLIEAEGVGALTLRELARRLGVSHAAPINHFADKDALLAELAAEGFAELAADLEAAGQGKTAVARLRDTGRAYVRFALRRPGHFRVMFGHGFSRAASSPRLAETGTRAYAALQQTVIAAMPGARAPSAQRVREASFLAWSVVHGAAMLILDGPLSPQLLPEVEEAAVDALVDHATAVVAKAISS